MWYDPVRFVIQSCPLLTVMSLGSTREMLFLTII